MKGTDWTGISLVIAATGTAIAVVINAIKTARTTKATLEKVIEIDRAVNQKEPGAQTMSSQVNDLHKRPGRTKGETE